MPCASCGEISEPDAHFCVSCGAPLSDVAAPAEATRPPNEGERKQVSLLFADVQGSMDISERLDTEQWWVIMDRFFELLSDGVHRFEGTVLRFTGDGVMAVFGAPVAHEDHARRAAHAALALRAAIADYAPEVEREHGVRFEVRMGINSGEVVMGTIGAELSVEYAAIGRSAGLAERMERLAKAGTVYVSAPTARLIDGYFELAELGEHTVKGASRRQQVFELLGPLDSRSRVESGRAARAPLVGREREQAILQMCLERALEGHGQVVELVGEAGVGKSRLAFEFADMCEARGLGVLHAGATPNGREAPLGPVLELWREALGVEADGQPAAARERSGGRLLELDSAFEDDLAVVWDFLGVADPERPPEEMAPEARQRRLIASMRRLIRATSARRATVIVIEDTQWIDDASAVFLNELVDLAAGARMLLISTRRSSAESESDPDGFQAPHCTRVTLPPLGEGAVGELLSNLLGAASSLDGVSEMIGARALGNPFFCEELVRELAASGHISGARGAYRLSRTLEKVVLPATVEATVAARIDRLAEREKRLVQVAAVLGHGLTEPMLGELSGLTDAELSDSLELIVSAELFAVPGRAGGYEYTFKHPLIQEVAYRSQLSARRQAVHGEAALVIQRLYPDRLDELAALVGRHYEASGDLLSAARFFARSAIWVGLSDIAQALTDWRKVTELVEALPGWRRVEERIEAVPDSPLTTGLALISHVRQLDIGWRVGMGEPEAETHYRVGRELALRSGDRVGLLGITDVYANVLGLSGYLDDYIELAEEGHRLSVEIGDPALRIAAAVVTIHSRCVLGRQTEALALADEMIGLAGEDPTLGGGLGVACPYAFCLMMKGSILSHLGRFEESKVALRRALRVSVEQGDSENEGFSHGAYVVLARYTDATGSVEDHALRGHEIAERTGSVLSRALSYGYVGRAHLMLGRLGEAVSGFERAIDIARSVHTGVENQPSWLAGLSEALLAMGDRDGALRAARESVELGRLRGSKVLLGACHRALAEALLAGDGAGDVAAGRRALDEAEAAARAAETAAELPFIERVRARVLPASS